MPQWIVYYADGGTASSVEAAPHEVPRRFVICVAVRDDRCGRLVWFGADYYCWHDGTWVPHDLSGLVQYLDVEPFPVRLCGYGVSYGKFSAIYQQALDDPRLPVKTARDEREIEPPT